MGVGIILGVFVIVLEIEYKKMKEKKMRKHDVSRNAFATWRKKVEVNESVFDQFECMI